MQGEGHRPHAEEGEAEVLLEQAIRLTEAESVGDTLNEVGKRDLLRDLQQLQNTPPSHFKMRRIIQEGTLHSGPLT